MALKNMPFRKEIRRKAALARAEERETRTPQQQLQIVIDRGYPNCREANRLRELIAHGPTTPPQESSAES